MAIDFAQFPNLLTDGFDPKSRPDVTYNCVAFAAGITDEWWQPNPEDGYFWPDDLPEDDFIDTLVLLYEGLGYDLCEDGSFDPEMEKVALYAISNRYTHAARQLPNGKWVSKLGVADDIEHPRPESVSGGLYGRALHFLERRRSPANGP